MIIPDKQFVYTLFSQRLNTTLMFLLSSPLPNINYSLKALVMHAYLVGHGVKTI